MDSKVLVELQEAERQAQQTAIIITDLKQSVAQLLCVRTNRLPKKNG